MTSWQEATWSTIIWRIRRAELYRQVGRIEEARRSFQRALELTQLEPERRFLERRLEEPGFSP